MDGDRTVIDVGSVQLVGNERKYVLDCLNRGWLSQGYYVQQLEEKLAEASNCEYAIACSSGTTALHLAMIAQGVGKGINVIMPDFTYIATANAATYCGATLDLRDVDVYSWCMPPVDWGDHMSVVVGVDMYDARCSTNYDILDAAHTSPTCLNLHDNAIATYSFYASKLIACGEGGAVVTNDEELYKTMRLYWGQGTHGKGVYKHSVVGYNYRMSDLQAAVALAQLEQVNSKVMYRRKLINRYIYNLTGHVVMQGGCANSAWAYCVLVADRDRVRRHLLDAGINTRPAFTPISEQPAYQNLRQFDNPVSNILGNHGVVLPLHNNLTYADIDYISSRLLEVTNQGDYELIRSLLSDVA